MVVVSGLHGQIDAKTVRVRRVTVKDPQFPDSPSAAFIKFDDRTSGNVYLIKVSDSSPPPSPPVEPLLSPLFDL